MFHPVCLCTDNAACDVHVHGCACSGDNQFLDSLNDKKQCVPQDMCSCYDFVSEKVYPAGAVIEEDCRKWYETDSGFQCSIYLSEMSDIEVNPVRHRIENLYFGFKSPSFESTNPSATMGSSRWKPEISLSRQFHQYWAKFLFAVGVRRDTCVVHSRSNVRSGIVDATKATRAKYNSYR